MASGYLIPEGLRKNLLEVLRNPDSTLHVHGFVLSCHAIANAYIRHSSSARFACEIQDVTPAQLAYDCIADLFIRRQDGQFARIVSYFESLDLETLSDAEIIAHVRRLVGGIVHQALFRVYNEADPTLGRILRNLKLAIQSLGNFREIERFGEPCLTPVLCDPLDHLPLPPLSILEAEIFRHAVRRYTVPDLLSSLSLFLRQQSDYCRMVPLVDVARTFRAVFSRDADQEPVVCSGQTSTMDGEDVHKAIACACNTVKKKMFESYVASGRVPERTFALYVESIDLYLRSKLDSLGEQLSLKASFTKIFPDPVHKEYLTKHRGRLEYMARMAEQLIHKRLKQ